MRLLDEFNCYRLGSAIKKTSKRNETKTYVFLSFFISDNSCVAKNGKRAAQ